MKFEEWEPIYKSILDDMGFDRASDEHAAQFLSGSLESKATKDPSVVLDIKDLKKTIEGKDVLVCGNAPKLRNELNDVDVGQYVVIAADGATSVLLDKDTVPDIIVSDLDGNMDDEVRANELGAIMVVHAHGDNMDVLREYVPKLKNIVGTTQAKPLHNVYNFGGFSDGDRCVFLAMEMGAVSITLVGFDFKDEAVTPIKKKKLVWAEKLIDMATGN